MAQSAPLLRYDEEILVLVLQFLTFIICFSCIQICLLLVLQEHFFVLRKLELFCMTFGFRISINPFLLHYSMKKKSSLWLNQRVKLIHFIQTKVDISKDSIYVNGNRISKKLPPKLYFAVNKPKGLVSYFPCFSCVLHRCHDYLAFQ